MAWTDAQAREFARSIRRAHSHIWSSSFVTNELRCALVAQHLLGVVEGQAADTVRPVDVSDLHRRVLRLLRLSD